MRGAAFVITALAALIRLPWMHGRLALFPPADATDWVGMARSVAHGTAFPEGGIPRTPGYGYFVALCDLLPGAPMDDVALVQHGLGVALVAAVCLLGSAWFGAAVGLASGAFLAISPQLFAIEDETLPDFLTACALLAVAVLVVRAAAPDRLAGRRPWALAGAAVAAAALVKPVALLCLAAIPIVLLAARAGRRRTALATLVAGVTAGLALTPWVLHNAVVHGTPTLSNQVGITLYNRVFEVDGRAPVADGSAQSAVVRQRGAALVAQGLRPHVAALTALQERFHYDTWEAAGVERRLAEEEIRRYPLDFAWRTVRLAAGAAPAARPERAAAVALLPRAGTSRTGLPQLAWRLAAEISGAWWVLTLNGWALLAGLLLARGRARARLVALVAVGALAVLATAVTHGGLARYWDELLPLTVLASAAGTGAVVAALLRGRAVAAGHPHPAPEPATSRDLFP